MAPDFIGIKVDAFGGGKPSHHIDEIINQAELRAVSDHDKRVAGILLNVMNAARVRP